MQTKAQTFVRSVVLFAGVLNTLIALTILFAPEFFYTALADFPPFNRHFLGDIGAFMLGPNLALLFAARNPSKHRALIGAVALSNLIHFVNHLYDDLFVEHGATLHWLTNTVPLLALTILLGVAFFISRERNR
jgi:hypothetical protein